MVMGVVPFLARPASSVNLDKWYFESFLKSFSDRHGARDTAFGRVLQCHTGGPMDCWPLGVELLAACGDQVCVQLDERTSRSMRRAT